MVPWPGVVEPRGERGPACGAGRDAVPARAADRPHQQQCDHALLHVHLEAVLCRVPRHPAPALMHTTASSAGFFLTARRARWQPFLPRPSIFSPFLTYDQRQQSRCPGAAAAVKLQELCAELP